jgi:hypothetical protein
MSVYISRNNKHLRVREGVALTQRIDKVIAGLDPYFEKANVISYVTSGVRDAASQLRIIRAALINNKLADQYQEAFNDLNSKMIFDGEEVYGWQPGWSKLLNIGYIVNPPLSAKVLMDYYRPGSTENKKGKIIGPTPHASGGAFDIGGGANGLTDEFKVIKEAISDGFDGIKSYLLERNNNCLHVDCK